jgi:hypothetical protein
MSLQQFCGTNFTRWHKSLKPAESKKKNIPVETEFHESMKFHGIDEFHETQVYEIS